jgi:prepilin-type N-terminal cleavage/methylation domain-containing protein
MTRTALRLIDSRARRAQPPRGRLQAGFTLVEMAVVVIILSLIMTMGLSAAGSMLLNSQREVTRERMKAVRDAMVGYFAQNHRFPCPDAGSNVGNTGRDGLEDRAVGGPNPDPASACVGAMGTVPYVTLGLSRDQALDAWGNFISYRLTTAPAWHLSATFARPAPPAAPVCNPAGIVAPPLAGLGVFSSPTVVQTNAAAWVLISHGRNGLGAWNTGPNNTSRNDLPTGADELANTQLVPAAPAGYRAYPFSDVELNPMDDLIIPMVVGELNGALTKAGQSLCF